MNNTVHFHINLQLNLQACAGGLDSRHVNAAAWFVGVVCRTAEKIVDRVVERKPC